MEGEYSIVVPEQTLINRNIVLFAAKSQKVAIGAAAIVTPHSHLQ